MVPWKVTVWVLKWSVVIIHSYNWYWYGVNVIKQSANVIYKCTFISNWDNFVLQENSQQNLGLTIRKSIDRGEIILMMMIAAMVLIEFMIWKGCYFVGWFFLLGNCSCKQYYSFCPGIAADSPQSFNSYCTS